MSAIQETAILKPADHYGVISKNWKTTRGLNLTRLSDITGLINLKELRKITEKLFLLTSCTIRKQLIPHVSFIRKFKYALT